MRALVVCIAMFFAQCATAAVTINIIETGGHVEAVLSGNLNLGATLGLVGPSFGTDKYNASAGIVGFTNGDTEYYAVDVGIWTPFGPGGTGTWFSSSGDAFTMYSPPNVGVPPGYISGNALSATATSTSPTLAALGFTIGTYVTTLTNGPITDTVTIIVGEAVPTYSVGGTVSGLTGTGLALQNNGGDTLAVAAAATAFTFSTAQAEGSDYAVTVSSQPTGQTCTVTNGSGAIAAADVTDVAVDCVDDVVVVPPTSEIPIPTLSQWALIMLSMFLGLMLFANRKLLF